MKLNLLVLRTSNTQKLAKFYEKLGITFQYHQHGKGPFHYSADLNGLIFEIYPLLQNQEKPDHTLRIGFEVERLNELITQLQVEKIEIVKTPKQTAWGYVAVIKDLDGRKIELTES